MNTYDIPDHPVVRNMERTGYPNGKEPKIPRCPMCDEETETFYKTIGSEIVGCDKCISAVSAWDETEMA